VGASEPPTGFRIYAIDVGAGQAGFYGVMKERDRPLIIALRLKAVNGQITENVPGVDSLPLGGSSSNLQAGEIFKIDHGRIIAVEAMGASLPYGTKSGWGE
jgi:hypothetical protein